MTREIKFRAWSKQNKGMYFIGYMLSEICQMDCLKTDWNDLEISQFTGLFDKNGNEIYGGDILKVTAILSDESFIIKVEWDIEMARYITGNSPLSAYAKQSEVIGNIYENPELIANTAKE